MGSNEIFTTQDGSHSVISPVYGVSYHSRYGAIQESRHVFLEAGLFYLLPQRTDISLLEMGFGTGLNALLTLLESAGRGIRIRYTAYEVNPLTESEALSLNYPLLLSGERVQERFNDLHRSGWDIPVKITPDFFLEKRKKDLLTLAESDSYDLVYYDAFAPEAQPELWTAESLEKVVRAMKVGGVLVTYCAKGALKRTLKSLGMAVESIKGPPGKREMTRAIKLDGHITLG